MAGRYPRPGAPAPSSQYLRPNTSGRAGENPYPWLGKVFQDAFSAGDVTTEERTGRGTAREGLGRGIAPKQIESLQSSPAATLGSLGLPPDAIAAQARAPLSGGVRDPSRRPPGEGIGLPRLEAVKASKEGPGFLKRNSDILMDLGLGMMAGRPGANFLETVGTAGMQAIDRNEAREQRDLDRKSALKAELRADGFAANQAAQIAIQAEKFEHAKDNIIQWSTDKDGYYIGITRDPSKPFIPKDSKGNKIKPPKTAKNPMAEMAAKMYADSGGGMTMAEAIEATKEAYEAFGSSGNPAFDPTTGIVK